MSKYFVVILSQASSGSKLDLVLQELSSDQKVELIEALLQEKEREESSLDKRTEDAVDVYSKKSSTTCTK